MIVQRSSMNVASPFPSSLSSSSLSSSSKSNSSVTTHFFQSSTDSSSSSLQSSSSSYYFSPSSRTRCEGLNLLVKAIHQVVAGSIVGVPYIQRRVVRRRRRALRFDKLVITNDLNKQEGGRGKLKSKITRQKREMPLPVKYQDSILQPWKGRSRRRQQSIKIGDGETVG